MKNVLVSSFLGFILLYSFDEYFDKKIPVVDYLPKTHGIILNPLDAILGDKKLEDGSIRRNNFDSIPKIKASYLKDSSQLYHVQELTKNTFFLKRKKFFIDNKRYALLVKTQGDRIVSYYAVNDFEINGVVSSGNKIYFVGNDYTGISNEWQSTYAVKIKCMNLNFQEEWSTVSKPNSYYFLFAKRLNLVGDMLVATFEIQESGSSSMCYTTYDLFMNKMGKPLSQVYHGDFMCGPPPGEMNFLELFL